MIPAPPGIAPWQHAGPGGTKAQLREGRMDRAHQKGPSMWQVYGKPMRAEREKMVEPPAQWGW
eukprot:9601790-Alexandrium_andersonii.AAC.1